MHDSLLVWYHTIPYLPYHCLLFLHTIQQPSLDVVYGTMKKAFHTATTFWLVASFTTAAAFLGEIRHAGRIVARPLTASSTTGSHGAPWKIALTREEGKNGKLQKALEKESSSLSLFEAIELPCIAHADGPDLASLAQRLRDETWDYVVVTSPEAAKVVASAWPSSSTTPVAAVGKATQDALQSYGIPVCFTPSKATAATLVQELPGKAPCKVLYPASRKAKTTLQNGLTDRGFEVVRLNTYDTVTATWTTAEQQQARQCRVACFASPSSVKGWLQNTNDDRSVLAACIGETSATACREHGWPDDQVFFPDQPGMEGWVQAVKDATESLHATQKQ